MYSAITKYVAQYYVTSNIRKKSLLSVNGINAKQGKPILAEDVSVRCSMESFTTTD